MIQVTCAVMSLPSLPVENPSEIFPKWVIKWELANKDESAAQKWRVVTVHARSQRRNSRSWACGPAAGGEITMQTEELREGTGITINEQRCCDQKKKKMSQRK